MKQPSRRNWLRLVLVFIGLFGIAFAVTGLVVSLPAPAVGGTCGPTKASEPAIVAFFDPGSIGAGAEPSSSKATDRAEWMAFVGECQASADSRVLATFAILVLTLAVAAAGTALVLRRSRRPQPLEPVPPTPYREEVTV